MIYLDSRLGNQASIVLSPTPNSIELLDAAGNSSIPVKYMGAHLALLSDSSDVDSDGVGAAIRRVASRFGSVEGEITEVADIGIEGEGLLAQAVIVESQVLQQIYDQVTNALDDGEIEHDSAEAVSLHIPVILGDSDGDANLESLVGEKIKFDHFSVINSDDAVTYTLENSDDKVDKFYISSRRSDCDGYAVIRTRDDGLVCCHANRTIAQEAMDELIEEDAGRRSSSLVRLSNGVIEETDVCLNRLKSLEVANYVTIKDSDMITLTSTKSSDNSLDSDPKEATFNIVESDTLGSFPMGAQASMRQMERLVSSGDPEIEGPAVVTGVESGDRRLLYHTAFVAPRGGLSTRMLPLPYMFGDVRSEYHLDAQLGGWIVSIEPVMTDEDGNYALFTRTKLVESEFGQEIYDRFSRGEFRGVSADLDRTRSVDLEAGSVVDGGPLRVVVNARFMGMTAVTFPALEEAGLWLTGDDMVTPTASSSGALVASGGSIYKPELQIVSSIDNFQIIKD